MRLRGLILAAQAELASLRSGLLNRRDWTGEAEVLARRFHDPVGEASKLTDGELIAAQEDSRCIGDGLIEMLRAQYGYETQIYPETRWNVALAAEFERRASGFERNETHTETRSDHGQEAQQQEAQQREAVGRAAREREQAASAGEGSRPEQEYSGDDGKQSAAEALIGGGHMLEG